MEMCQQLWFVIFLYLFSYLVLLLQVICLLDYFEAFIPFSYIYTYLQLFYLLNRM